MSPKQLVKPSRTCSIMICWIYISTIAARKPTRIRVKSLHFPDLFIKPFSSPVEDQLLNKFVIQ